MFKAIKNIRNDIMYLVKQFTEHGVRIDKLHREIHELKQAIHGESLERIEGRLLFDAGERGLKTKVHDISVRQRALEEYLKVRPKEAPAIPTSLQMVPWPEPQENDDA